MLLSTLAPRTLVMLGSLGAEAELGQRVAIQPSAERKVSTPFSLETFVQPIGASFSVREDGSTMMSFATLFDAGSFSPGNSGRIAFIASTLEAGTLTTFPWQGVFGKPSRSNESVLESYPANLNRVDLALNCLPSQILAPPPIQANLPFLSLRWALALALRAKKEFPPP